MKDQNCEKRIDASMEVVIDDLKRILGGEEHEILEMLTDYALDFDYVPAGTFNDQKEGYFRYQISWGGPSDEFRFFTDANRHCHRVEYWLMDWFDGARRVCTGEAEHIVLRLWKYLETSD